MQTAGHGRHPGGLGHGGPAPPDGVLRGGLAPWQERRAKQMLAADLKSRVRLGELAAACRLSRSHFARAFKASTGLAPHQWRLREQVRLAQRLLAGSARPIGQIAAECGFADQSHLTRAFSRIVHATPARWRAERRRSRAGAPL
jgi:AraC-like DNA-binding protein